MSVYTIMREILFQSSLAGLSLTPYDKKVGMFRPDPNGTHSLEEIIAKLTEVLKDVPPDSSRAQKLADMIDRLLETKQSGGTT